MWPIFLPKPPPTYQLATAPFHLTTTPSHSSRTALSSAPSTLPKMIILVRTDLNLSIGKIAAHAAHAAVSLYRVACSRPNACARWMSTGQRKSVLRSSSERELDVALECARRLRLAAVAVRTPGEMKKFEGEGRKEGGEGKGVLVKKGLGAAQKTAVAILGPAHVLESFTARLERF